MEKFAVASLAPVSKVRALLPTLVGLTLLGAGAANAQTVSAYTFDPAPIVTVIAGGVTSVAAIGVAVISLVVVIKLFKWVQRVL